MHRDAVSDHTNLVRRAAISGVIHYTAATRGTPIRVVPTIDILAHFGMQYAFLDCPSTDMGAEKLPFIWNRVCYHKSTRLLCMYVLNAAQESMNSSSQGCMPGGVG